MSQRVCEICNEEFDQTKHLPRQVECGCIRCEDCLRDMYKDFKHFKCPLHNHVSYTQVDQLKKVKEFLQPVSSTQSQPIQKCKQHQEELKYYCQDDKIQVCEKCINQVHVNHLIQPIQQRIQEQNVYSQQLIQIIKQKIDQQLDQIKNTQKNLLQQNSQVQSKIILINNKLHHQIKQASQLFLQESRIYFKKVYRQLTGIKENLLNKLILILRIKIEEVALEDQSQQITNLQQLNSSIDSQQYKIPPSLTTLMNILQQDEEYENHL